MHKRAKPQYERYQSLIGSTPMVDLSHLIDKRPLDALPGKGKGGKRPPHVAPQFANSKVFNLCTSTPASLPLVNGALCTGIEVSVVAKVEYFNPGALASLWTVSSKVPSPCGRALGAAEAGAAMSVTVEACTPPPAPPPDASLTDDGSCAGFSMKDRIVKEILDDAERRKLLQPGGTIVAVSTP